MKRTERTNAVTAQPDSFFSRWERVIKTQALRRTPAERQEVYARAEAAFAEVDLNARIATAARRLVWAEAWMRHVAATKADVVGSIDPQYAELQQHSADHRRIDEAICEHAAAQANLRAAVLA